MAEKLTNKLESHRTAFVKKQIDEDGNFDWTAWFLNIVVFPSLMDIAERVDAIEASRRKGNGDG